MSWRLAVPLAGVLFLVTLGILSPALHGERISEDLLFLETPYVQELSAENLRVIFDPTGPLPRIYLNYAPLHALAHAIEIQLFGDRQLGYHVVNVALHALVALLFAALLLQLGFGPIAAGGAALLFAVHPANVEAIAWITQLKTLACASLALGALLLHPRRPALGALLFAMALLTKAHAAFALFVLAMLVWLRRSRAEPDEVTPRLPANAPWLAVWVALLVAYAWVEVPIYQEMGAGSRPVLEASPFLHLRTVLAIVARYAAMTVTGYGLSAFHETQPAHAIGDPWWIAGLVIVALVAWRFVAVLRRRSPEAVFWVWSFAAFAPISQYTPFTHMMADRYLYLILPGLIGITLYVGRDLLARLHGVGARRSFVAGSTAAVAVLAMAFGAIGVERARVWRNTDSVYADVARHYPDGVHAHLQRARSAAWVGDDEGAVASLRAARKRGWSWIGVLFQEPAFARIRNRPRFRFFVREATGDLLQEIAARPNPGATELQTAAQLHLWRGERAEAEAALRRALALGGRSATETRDALARFDQDGEGDAPPEEGDARPADDATPAPRPRVP